MPKATRLDHIAIAVRDIDAGIAKWTTLLGAELVAKQKITLQGRMVEAAAARDCTTSPSRWTTWTPTSGTSRPPASASPTASRSAHSAARSC